MTSSHSKDSWTDCPDRERSQWTFDVAMDVHQSMYGLGVAAQSLNMKWILELAAWQKTDNTSPAYEPSYAPASIYAPVPGHWVDELPNQSLQSIAYGFLTYWRHTGDADTVKTMLPAVVRYLLSFRVMAVGSSPSSPSSPPSSSSSGMLVVPRSCPGEPHAADVQCAGIWDWCDGQSTNCDYAPIDNAWYFWALNSTVVMANAVNSTRSGGEVSPVELSTLERRASGIRAGFESFWDPSCSCYRSTAHKMRPGGTTDCRTKQDNCTLPDDRVQGLAIVTGLAPKENWGVMVKNVLDLASPNAVANGSTAMEKFALEAMFLAGEHDAALVRMQSRFGPMIAYNYSTLWEHWDIDAATGAPVGGYNHGWSGGALVLLSQYVAGLSPTSPGAGWATFDVRPELGVTLNKVSAAVQSTYGEITVAVHRRIATAAGEVGTEMKSTPELAVELRVPPGTAARLHLPKSFGIASAVVSNQDLAEDACAQLNSEDGLYVREGTWTITALGT